MKEIIESKIKEVLKNIGINEDISFNVEHPDDLKNGDYSTNVAMSMFPKLISNFTPSDYPIKTEIFGGDKGSSRDFAKFIKLKLEENILSGLDKIEVAGPGFINFYLSREFFVDSVKEILNKGNDWGKNKILKDKKVMVEYTDPNPFKPFHIGHLMANTIGESISRIVEFSGANTIRANYQGDVGPHVAKAIYVILKSKEYLEIGLQNITGSISDKAIWIGECYSKGSNLYDTDENTKKEIEEINKKVYEKSDEKINEIYNWGRKTTLEAFEEIYKLLGTKFDYYFFESEMAKVGEKIVKENVGNVFEESDGAIVFHGENYDKKLHTRVFINSQSLPTYETKEIGLTITKFEKENPDISIITTAIEQAEYMKVVQKAISLIHPELESRMKHITHGMMKLTSGKMSSRKGNIITGESLLRDSMNMIIEKMISREFSVEEKKKIAEVVGVGALKYSILKSSLGSDIIYDQEKSVSFEGDSGPYLQYTAVRANGIFKKSESFNLENRNQIPEEITNFEKLLYQFPEIVKYSYEDFAPHHIAVYLVELASEFNSFYGNTQILKNDNLCAKYHLDLIKAFYQTVKNGLWLLGIEVPEKM